MRDLQKKAWLLMLCLLGCGVAQAQQAADALQIYYRQGYRYIDPALRDNGKELDRFTKSIENALQQEKLERVVIRSYTSPDGTDRANTALAAHRVDSLASYLLRHTGLSADLLEKHAGGIAWELLRDKVAASDMPYRDEVLQILDNTPVWIYNDQGKIIDGRKKRLMDLLEGVPYRYMYEEFFPELRSSIAATLYLRREKLPEPAPEPEPAPTPEIQTEPQSGPKPVQTEPAVIPAEPAEKVFRPLIAIKTNLLYWATAMPDFHSYTYVPNLEAEWFFSDRWSLSGTGNYTNRGYGNGEFFGISSWSLEPRWWFNGDGLYRWFYLGVYGQVGDYDVKNPRTEPDGRTGNLWGTGLSFGVAIPFTNRLGLELGLRGGYRHSDVKIYSVEAPDYFLDRKTQDDHWGVTGIKASLYFRFGKGSK